MWRKIRDWGLAPARTIRAQIPRALIASVFAAALDFTVLVMLVEYSRWHPVPAAVFGYLIGAMLQYILCYRWVFAAAPSQPPSGFVGFMVLSLVGLAITGITIAVLHDLARINYAIAKVAALGLAFTWNFISRKVLIFKPGVEHGAA